MDDYTPLFELIKGFTRKIEHGAAPWEDYEQEIQKPEVIRTWAAAIRQAPATLPLRRVQDFLAGFAIAFYDIEPALTTSAKAWISLAEAADTTTTAINADPDPSATFHSALAEYTAAYQEWKTRDRAEVLDKLAQMYWEYQMSYELGIGDLQTQEEKEYFTTLLKHRQEELLAQMEAIDHLAYFRSYLPITVGPDVSALIKDTLERAFWNRIKEDIAQDPQNYASLLPVIRELRDISKELDPRKADWYDDVFDCEYIQEQLASPNTSAIPFTFWLQRLDAAMETLIILDSEANAPIHKKWFEDHPPTTPVAAMDAFAYVIRRLTNIKELKDHLHLEA